MNAAISRFPASFAQRRLWFIQQFDARSAAYNMVVSVELPHAATPALVQRALDALCAHRETLRTGFAASDGDVVQLIQPEGRIDLSVHHLSSREAFRSVVSASAAKPFALDQAPLARACAAYTPAAPPLLVLVLHHIVADGVTLQILLNDLQALLRALSEAREVRLPQPPVEYADYAVWQRRALAGKRLQALTEYWRQRLDGIPWLDLPGRRAGRAGQRGRVVPLDLEPASCRGLRELAAASKATVFAVLLTAFCVLLARFSGQRDFGIGIPVSGRNRVELEQVAGLFVNSVVFRARLPAGASFAELVRLTAAALGDDLSRQEMPFELLVDALRVQRSADRNPLFQVMLQLQQVPAPGASVRVPSASVDLIDPEGLSSQLDLSAIFFDCGDDGIRGGMVYGADLFEARWIEQLASAYRVLLDAALADPDRPCEQLPLLDEQARRALLALGAGPSRGWPRDSLLHDDFDSQVRQRPDAVALRTARRAFTYSDLDARANTLAHRLHTLGLRPGDTLALCSPRSVGTVVAMVAALRCGAAYLSIDHAAPRAHRELLLEDSLARAVIVPAGGNALGCGLPVFELAADGDIPIDSAASSAAPFGPRPSARSTAYLIYTSGSTGRPKGVRIAHAAIVNHMRWMLEQFEIGPGDRILQRTPTTFDASVWEVWAPLLSGATLVLADTTGPFDPAQLAREILGHRITVLQVVPSLLRALLPSCAAGELDSLRLLCCGGEPLDGPLVRAAQAACQARLVNLYGPSETTIDATFHVCAPGGGDFDDVPIGRPIANVTARVLNERLELLPWGVRGELCIGGAAVGLGYQGRDELTAERFVADPFAPGSRLYRSGDIVRMTSDGTLHYVGRRDDQVKLRGYRIELGEIEACLLKHEAVAEAAAVVQQPAAGDQRLVAFVVVRADRVAPSGAELQARLRDCLPAYAVPSTTVIVDALPRTSHGKIDRAALRAHTVEPARPALPQRVPHGVLERCVCTCFARQLGLDGVDPEDDFFQIGGHSLLVIALCTELSRATGLAVGIVDVFEFPTPRQLTLALQRRERRLLQAASAQSTAGGPP